MPKYIGVSREKYTRLCSVWLHLFGGGSSCREADDSNAVAMNQTHNLLYFHVHAGREGVKESARGRTEEWRDQVPTRLNLLWLRSRTLLQAKCCHCSFFLFLPLLLSLLWPSGVEHNIMPNNSSTLPSELAAGVFTFHHSSSVLHHIAEKEYQ